MGIHQLGLSLEFRDRSWSTETAWAWAYGGPGALLGLSRAAVSWARGNQNPDRVLLPAQLRFLTEAGLKRGRRAEIELRRDAASGRLSPSKTPGAQAGPGPAAHPSS